MSNISNFQFKNKYLQLMKCLFLNSKFAVNEVFVLKLKVC